MPEHVPDPQTVMMAGFLDFGSLHQIQFWASCAVIVLGIVLYVRNRENVAKKLLVAQVFFDVAAFPILKKMTGVHSCFHISDRILFKNVSLFTFKSLFS